MSFRRILVPLDLSDSDGPALSMAVQQAELGNGTITLLHVIETLLDVPFDELETFYRGLEAKARRRLDLRARRLTKRGARVRQAVVFGKRTATILAYARRHKADLIVLTSHRVSPRRATEGWGSISHRVALLASCPVMLLK